MSELPNKDDLGKRTFDEKAVLSVIMEQGHEIDRKLDKLDEKLDRKIESVEGSLTLIRERTAELKHLATKEDLVEVKRLITEDVKEVKVLIANRETSMQRWLMGTLLTVIGTLALALIKLWGAD